MPETLISGMPRVTVTCKKCGNTATSICFCTTSCPKCNMPWSCPFTDYNSIKDLEPVNPADLAEFKRAMEEDVITEFVRISGVRADMINKNEKRRIL